MNKHKIYRVINGTSGQAMRVLLDLVRADGLLAINGDEVVVIKPNLQWFNQGAPNIAAAKALIDYIFAIKGFHGEVVIAENNHSGPRPWEKGGWSNSFVINSDLEGVDNYNQLVRSLAAIYKDRFTCCHWIDMDKGGRRSSGIDDGPGYVVCDGTADTDLISVDNGVSGKGHRTSIMTYPLFRTARGTWVDLRRGVWAGSSFEQDRLVFIDLAALNHHSFYCGATSSIKNFFGVVDLTGGADPRAGRIVGPYFNFHAFCFDKWSRGPRAGAMGLVVGTFLKAVRKPNLCITTARYIGLCSRTEPPIAKTNVVMASLDPVALDYHATKYVLYPNSRIKLHNPDNPYGPLWHDLKTCAQVAGYCVDERAVQIVTVDAVTGIMCDNSATLIKGQIDWGGKPRSILKYLAFRLSLQGLARIWLGR